jgi:hypothetical protein
MAVIPTLPGWVHAQASPDMERQKAHIVSRMYQATYGAQERCRSAEEASEGLDKAIGQLRGTLPELMTLVDASPYLPQAQAQFKAMHGKAPAVQDRRSLIEECAAIENLLRQLIETPGGKKAASDMIDILRK